MEKSIVFIIQTTENKANKNDDQRVRVKTTEDKLK